MTSAPRLTLWLAAGLASALLTVLVLFPASWLGVLLEKQTGGRLTLADAHGTLWAGSGYIGGAPNNREPITPLLPGRLSWQLSPMILLGSVDATLEDDDALSPQIHVTGSWHLLRVSPGAIWLPAERLWVLGAPLNTIQPAGQLRLSWETLELARQGGRTSMTGAMKLEIRDITSRLSPVKPLGSYDLGVNWQGTQAALTLKTLKGPMLLDGSGRLAAGTLQFSGTARSEAGHEDRLSNLLNLLGQRRRDGEKDVIALEFK